ELTGNLNITLPGMIAVVSAEITVRALTGDVSAFTAMLKVQHAREAIQQDPLRTPLVVNDDATDKDDTKAGEDDIN
ncbi:MAG: hypothetical protein WBO73_14235, partial [Gammaproteobacteria bacterium]